ncbi:MAG: hypothetical protein LBU65_00335 [Planctomycetaceae bacterium]|jgi:hypothetical protein|nr:hypothetical protein [Planctomycetaceae bacterium]
MQAFHNQIRNRFRLLSFCILLTVALACVIGAVMISCERPQPLTRGGCYLFGSLPNNLQQSSFLQPLAQVTTSILLAIYTLIITSPLWLRKPSVMYWITFGASMILPLPIIFRENGWANASFFWVTVVVVYTAAFFVQKYNVLQKWSQKKQATIIHCIDNETENSEPNISTNTLLKMTRTRENGIERIDAICRIDFVHGQSLSILHIPFVPPFETIPEIETEPLTESPLTITVQKILTTGARIDVKRQAADEKQNVTIAVGVAEVVSS